MGELRLTRAKVPSCDRRHQPGLSGKSPRILPSSFAANPLDVASITTA
jgi:hypothetical protein